MTPRGAFEGLKRDPITGAMINAACWNGIHDEPMDDYYLSNRAGSESCGTDDCECWCHTCGPATEDSRQADAGQVESSTA